ncbi:MAG: YkgJ family cysteine cluster protein [Actinomycetota bacterium]|nr:YkgJ family cysteine cluster protein [Actinomycetota bacterium]
MTRRTDIDAALQDLYDQVPAIPGCQGKCWVSCGPIEMSDRERQRARHAGYRITDPREATRMIDTYWCEALTREGLCAIYDLRPLSCRLWGTTEGMPCPHGCQPERWLTDDQAFALVTESLIIGGAAAAGLHLADKDPDQILARWFASGARQIHQQLLARGRASIGIRLRATDGELPPEITSRPARKPAAGHRR